MNAVNTSSRLSYVTFKLSLLPEQYFDCVTLNCYGDALIKIRLGVLPINSLDALKMTRKSCVTFVKFRWRMKFTSSVCARYITGSGQNILILTCARKILSHNCFVAIHKKNTGSLLHLLFTPSRVKYLNHSQHSDAMASPLLHNYS